MKNKFRMMYFTIAGLIIAVCLFMTKADDSYNDYKCKTKQIELRGKIDYVSGHAQYMQAHVDNSPTSFSLNIDRVLYKKGFSKHYSFEVGDSIIKEKNSKVFTIKNGDKIAIYELDCDD